MPNITRGERMSGLLVYLAGPGKANEHTEPHLVAGDPAIMAWHDDTELSHTDALRIARELDHPRRAYGVEVPGGSVWHCSLSLRAEEGQLTDQRWAAIATDFVEGMGFTEAGQGGAKAACRWVAVRHGLSGAGNDHIHLAVSLVREDGTKANVWNDRPRAQTLAGELERQHGLQVLESRAVGRGSRGVKPAELARTAREGAAEPGRARLERTVRAVAAHAGTEAEFVRALRGAGLLARPRFASGTQDVVVGYSVALKPARGQRPVWFGGGSLARDLTLPRLRPGWPDTPAEAATAAGEWRAAWRGRRPLQPPLAGVSDAVVDEATWARYAAELGSLREQLRAVPVDDVDTWAQVAHTTAGAFAAWSLRVEGDRPGPLAATAAALARTGQVRAGQTTGAPPWGAESIRGATALLVSASRGGRGAVGTAVLLRQLSNTAKAIHDMHAAAGHAREAAAVADAVRGQLAAVRDRLPDPDLAAALTGDRSAAADAARLGTAHHTGATHIGATPPGERPLGSPLPAPLTPGRGHRPVGPAPGPSRGEELGR